MSPPVGSPPPRGPRRPSDPDSERTPLARLYLLRHASALSTTSSGRPRDAERPLSPEGVLSMGRASEGMRAAGIVPEAILASPYLRARQTAAIVADALGSGLVVEVVQELASGARWERVREALRDFDTLGSALLVGHQPDLSEMVSEILGGGPAPAFAPATLACLEVDRIPPLKPATLAWCRRSEELASLVG